jgi:hypothetical protein
LSDVGAKRKVRREARQRVRSSISDEAKSLAANERDREEMRLIREQLAELAPPRSVQTSNSA